MPEVNTSVTPTGLLGHDATDPGTVTKAAALTFLNVEDGADVTDTANVTAAGALMDSEVANLADVKLFDPTDYATAAQGSTADSALQSSDVTNVKKSAIEFVIDGGGSAITTGVKGFIEVPYACTITAVRLLADQSGSIVVDVWKDTYANYPPTDADSITASAVPTISTATKSEDATLTGWTTSVSVGDILGFNVDSITTCERVTVVLAVTIT